jgi:hypothetical protein
LAIFSASFVADFSSERRWSSFWSQASAGRWGATAAVVSMPPTPDWSDHQAVPNEQRRRALLHRVHQRLSSPSEAVDSILP